MKRSSKKACGSFKRQRGFTLVELMVTLAIIGILSAVATTNYLKGLPKMRTKEGVRQLWTDIYTARSEAAKSKDTIVLLFDTSNNTYSVVRDVGRDLGTGAPDASDKYIIQDKPFPDKVIFAVGNDIDGIQGGVVATTPIKWVNDRIFYHPSGRATTNNSDGAGSFPGDRERQIYIMHEKEGVDDWKDLIFGIEIEAISGIPTVKKYDYVKKTWEE